MPTFRARLVALAAVPLGAAVVPMAIAAPADAATAQTRYVETTGADGGGAVNDCTSATAPCRTIGHAVDEAAAGDTVSLAKGTYAESVVVDKPLTLTGAGRNATTISGSGAAGRPAVDVEGLGIDAADTVVLQHLAVSGNAAGPGVVALGSSLSISDTDVRGDADAGVYSLFGAVTVSDSTVSGTTRSAAGGTAFAEGSGITVLVSAATVDHSTVAGNAGAGIQVVDQSLLPGVAREVAPAGEAPATTLALRRSTVSGNAEGGLVNGSGTVAVSAVTVSGNVGGGAVGVGGSLAVTASTVTGTVPFPGPSGSQPAEQGGLIALSAVGEGPDLLPSAARRAAWAGHLVQVLAAYPAAQRQAVQHAARQLAARQPAADRARPAAAPAVLAVSGSIVAGQRGLPDCFNHPQDAGYNLSGDTGNSCGFGAAEHDQVRTEPKLGPLAANGGPTKTHLLLKGSPAIDAIPVGEAGCATGTTDQRDAARPLPTGGRCDTGAVELAALPIVIRPAALPGGTVGRAYAAALSATGGAYPTYSWTLASGALPDGLVVSTAGRVHGTPTRAGTFTFTVAVNDPVLKTYTIVIAPAPASSTTPPSAAPAGNGNEPIASTGTRVGSLLTLGSSAVLLGLLLVLAGTGTRFGSRRRPARHAAR